MKRLTHTDERGRVAMVDTGAKEETARRAVASARVLMSAAAVAAVRAARTAATASFDISTRAEATARLAVSSFAPVSTIATRPRASVCVSLARLFVTPRD